MVLSKRRTSVRFTREDDQCDDDARRAIGRDRYVRRTERGEDARREKSSGEHEEDGSE